MTIVRTLGRLTSVVALGVSMLVVPAGVAQAQEQVNVRFSWKLKGEYAALFVAQEKGFYAREGLAVRLGEGAGAPAALGALLQGQEDAVLLPAIFALAGLLDLLLSLLLVALLLLLLALLFPTLLTFLAALLLLLALLFPALLPFLAVLLLLCLLFVTTVLSFLLSLLACSLIFLASLLTTTPSSLRIGDVACS